jgi:uncharacterized protein
MLEFSEITIHDKPLFDKYLKLYNPQVSELTFTNLFMWRNFYKFRFAEAAGLLCILSVQEHREPFAFMPVGNLSQPAFDEAVHQMGEYFRKYGWNYVFKRVVGHELDFFHGHVGSETDIVLDRDNSDYIYLTQDMIRLSGKKYDGKRNHINKFKKLYDYEYVPLTEDYMDECCRIMDEWCAERNCEDHKEFHCEKQANIELLNNYGILGCKGALIRVNGRYEAFTVGEMQNSDTAVIHIEKANSNIHGVYTFINQQFCETEWKDAVYINREQDLGMEGLRKAKLSYNPCRLVEKYSVQMK